MHDTIAPMLAQVARLMRRDFDQRARTIGVTRPQWQVLSLLASNEGINQGGLADILEVEPITLGRMIDRLQDAGLVERRADPADRRAWRLYLRPEGERLLGQLRPLGHEMVQAALDGIEPEHQEMLLTMLDRIRGNLSRKTPASALVNG